MGFPEPLKKKIRKRANFQCCWCKKPSDSYTIEIHHILPKSEGGDDSEDNAAPLCPNCHDMVGGNPLKRKQIRERRDAWYEKCEEVERIAIRNGSYVLGSSEGSKQSSLENSHYSFAREELVHPLIVQELLGWISDSRETIISVDLGSSNRSNRFHGEFNVSDRDGRKWVEWESSEMDILRKPFFKYSHIATSPSGVEMVECYDCGGGSGVFGSVGLFCLEHDRALGGGKDATRERVILKTFGSICLGDRYGGKVTYEDGFLVIGPDNGWFNRGLDAARKLPIR